jgi:multidrug efflux pump subunit AcrA (membrane-fusion protein)
MWAVESFASAVVTETAAVALLGEQEARVPVSERQIEEAAQRVAEQAARAAEQAAQAAQAAQAVQSENAARLAQELDRAREAVANLGTVPGGGQVSVTRDGNGNITIKFPNGGSFVVSEGLVPPGALEGMIASMVQPPQPPPPFPGDGGPPDSVIRLLGVIFGLVALIVIGFPIARAFGRRIAGHAPPTGGGVPADLAARLERIEQAVDAVAVEVERVSEAQRYSARLLTERLPEVVPQLAGAESAAAARRSIDHG